MAETSRGWLKTPPSVKLSLAIQSPNGASPGSKLGEDPGRSGGGKFAPVSRSLAVFLNRYDQSSLLLGLLSSGPGVYQPPRVGVSIPRAMTGVYFTGPGPAFLNRPGAASGVVRTGLSRSPNS